MSLVESTMTRNIRGGGTFWTIFAHILFVHFDLLATKQHALLAGFGVDTSTDKNMRTEVNVYCYELVGLVCTKIGRSLTKSLRMNSCFWI